MLRRAESQSQYPKAFSLFCKVLDPQKEIMLGVPEENERNSAQEKWPLREETAFLGGGRGPGRGLCRAAPGSGLPGHVGRRKGREQEVHRRKHWTGSAGEEV